MEGNRKNGINAAGVLLICLGIAAVLSALCILFVREIFALNSRGRDGEAVKITAERDMDTDEIAVTLKENGLIGSETLFRLYSRLRGKYKTFSAGEYILSPSSGYDGIIHRLSGGGAVKRRQISVTVPEGSTVRDIIRIVCRENGICSEEELTETVKNGDFDKYYFVRELTNGNGNGDRLYRLEGYLYPDTYYFNLYFFRATFKNFYSLFSDFHIKIVIREYGIRVR